MQLVAELLRRGEAVVAGVLSGTSADGIDVGLTRMRADPSGRLRFELLAFDVLPFEAKLHRRLRAVLDGAPIGLREAAWLSRDLGRAFGAAARACANARGIELHLVASHGQTVWHHDGLGGDEGGPATLQLGDGDFVAEAAGAAAVSDFRQRDVACGGEGAPISALADGEIFASVPRPCAILNLGGIANLTVLGAHDDARGPRSFDTGPANALLDGLARRFLDANFDDRGACARRGRPHAPWIEAWSEHPFFARPPPKSTGRDSFGEAWIDGAIARARALRRIDDARAVEDLMASAADFVAAHVVDGCHRFGDGASRVILCGGGVHHLGVIEALGARAPQLRWIASRDVGVDPDAREALVFAVLGARCVLGVPSTQPSATGARAGGVLGKFSTAPGR